MSISTVSEVGMPLGNHMNYRVEDGLGKKDWVGRSVLRLVTFSFLVTD